MSLKDKYADLLKLGEELKLSDSKSLEEGGKLKVWGTAEYELQKDKFWDKVKTYAGWESDLVADIKVAKTIGVGRVKIAPTLEVFNLFNADPVILQRQTSYNPPPVVAGVVQPNTFNQPSGILNGRIFGVSATVRW